MALDLDLLERLDKEIREHLNQGDPADSASPLAQLQSHLLANLDEIIASVATVRDLADECPDLDPEDSRRLRELRQAIDEHLGWPDAESEERGDYLGRVRQLGISLENVVRRLALLASGADYGEQWRDAILDEATVIARSALRHDVRVPRA